MLVDDHRGRQRGSCAEVAYVDFKLDLMLKVCSVNCLSRRYWFLGGNLVRSGKQMVGICLMAILGSTSSEAGFKNNFSQWSEMDAYGKYSYVQGVFDRLSGFSSVGEDVSVAAERTGVTNCAFELKLNPKMFADAVTKHYEDHPDDWGFPPHLIFSTVVQRVCLRYINDERVKLGLDLWKSRSNSIAEQIQTNAQ